MEYDDAVKFMDGYYENNHGMLEEAWATIRKDLNKVENASANTGSPKLSPMEIERDYTFHTSEKNLVAFTETWEEHPDWWEDLPCLCSMCRSYGE